MSTPAPRVGDVIPVTDPAGQKYEVRVEVAEALPNGSTRVTGAVTRPRQMRDQVITTDIPTAP